MTGSEALTRRESEGRGWIGRSPRTQSERHTVVRLRRWCATGKLRCERDGDGWLIPISEASRIAAMSRAYGTALAPVRALADPAPVVPPDLADRVAGRLGPRASAVMLTPLALDGVDYVVAIWRGDVQGEAGLRAL